MHTSNVRVCKLCCAVVSTMCNLVARTLFPPVDGELEQLRFCEQTLCTPNDRVQWTSCCWKPWSRARSTKHTASVFFWCRRLCPGTAATIGLLMYLMSSKCFKPFTPQWDTTLTGSQVPNRIYLNQLGKFSTFVEWTRYP